MDEFKNPNPLEKSGTTKTNGLKIRPGTCALSAGCEIPISSEVSFRLEREWSGTSAFTPNNATSAKTQGINAVRRLRLSGEFMRAGRVKESETRGNCQTLDSNAGPQRSPYSDNGAPLVLKD